jgi:hypothetical protein
LGFLVWKRTIWQPWISQHDRNTQKSGVQILQARIQKPVHTKIARFFVTLKSWIDDKYVC